MPNLRDLGHKLYTGEVSYDFVGHRRRWYVISAILIAVSLLSIGIRGFQWGIEFEGGAEFQAQTTVTASTVTDMQEAVTNSGVPDLGEASVTTIGNDQVRVQTRTLDPVNEVPLVRTAIATEAGVPSNEVAYSLIGASWGGQITDRALIALGVFLLLVTLVIWAYFRNWKMSIAALVALLHDLVLTVGIYALVGFTVTPATVIGVLTILGYSLYDTVVVFDKVRENVRDLTSSARQTYSEAANLAVNQVLVRSINTTIIGVLPVAALLFAGAFILGEGPLKDLALALFVGMISGAYSSIFIATPLLAQLKEREPEMQKLTKRVLARRAKSEAKVGDPVAAGSVSGGSVAAGSVSGGSVDVAAYDPPAESTDDDMTEPGDPSAPPRPRITVSSTQPTVVNRPTRPTSEGASGRPQPQNKPRSQRKK
ncbi:MAG TPA: protein translocase subunit SecF [Microlunatus sp.]